GRDRRRRWRGSARIRSNQKRNPAAGALLGHGNHRLGLDIFVYGSTGSSEWRTREFANRRLNAIGKLIGKEEVTQAFRQAEQAFGKGVDQWAWKIFTEGSKEEQERFQQEVQERLARDAEEGRK